MTYYDSVYEKVWDTKFWLPKNITWLELNEYTNFDIKLLVIQASFLACFIYVVRIIFEKYISTPIGKFLQVPDKKIPSPNPQLEAYFKENQVMADSFIMLIAKETNLKSKYIKEWYRLKKEIKKPSTLQKFNESFWRFTFYSFIWVYGVYVLWDKPWTWNTNHCWIAYPRQYIDTSIYYYYFIEISFYFSLLVSQFTDVKRKDFWQMFLHHIITLSLLLWSFMCNFQRVGSLVLLLHDTVDPLLELAKMGSYAKINKICDPVFALFTIMWLLTRLIAFPYIILYTTTYEALNHLEIFPAYYYFNALLYCLQVMHVIWFFMILQVVKSIFKGVRTDVREEEDSKHSDHEHQE